MGARDWISQNFLRVKPIIIQQRIVEIEKSIISQDTETVYGTGPEWAPTVYGGYMARSTSVYAAIKLRADSLIRPPLKVYETKGEEKKEVPDHPLAELMRRVNPNWTRGDLWRGTSMYLDLWGSAFWILEKTSPSALPTEIRLARPDMMRIKADKKNYVTEFRYGPTGKDIPYLPDSIVWFRYINPLNELAGLSPLASARLSADMGMDAIMFNRQAFKEGLLFDNIYFRAEDGTTDAEVEEFYERLRKRYAGAKKAHRPLISTMEPKNMGFSPKEMEYIQSLRWSLEEVSRVYGVPQIMLNDLTNSTYANIDAAERIFWRNMATYCQFLQEEVTEMLCPQFGEGLSVEFDLSQIEALQPNINAIYERLRLNISSGIQTINEARAEMGMEPVPWGDAWWASMTLLPVTDTATEQAPSSADLEGKDYKLYPPHYLQDEYLDKVADMHVKRLDKQEQSFKTIQRKLWAKQEKAIVKRLSQMKTFTKQLQGELFNPDEWMNDFVRLGLPAMSVALAQSAEAHVEQFGLGISFDISHPLVKTWLDDRVAFWAASVNQETGRLLMGEIQEAHRLGEAIPQIQDRVEKVFDFSNRVRSERIARTEMQAATNKGALSAYEQSGVVEQKMWLATLDDRTRDHHLTAHRQVVPLEAPFLVGGEDLMQPGDGSPANSINCRCSVAPVIGRKKMPAPAPPEPKRVVKKVKRDDQGMATEIEEVHYG